MTERVQSRRRYGAVLATASGATFLAMLDSTVINLAVSDLRQQFPESSVTSVAWVITAYLVVLAALLAPAGRLADALGRRQLFLAGVGLFTVMSFVCALAPNLPVLIAARAVQGGGAAAMIPAALAILLIDGPAERRGTAIGVWSAASAVAAAVGPALGGVLVDTFGWRSVFFINLPFGVLMMIAALRILPRQVTGDVRRRLPDPFATALLAAGIAGLTLGIMQGETWHWDDPRTLTCLVGGALAVALALLRSARAPVPAIDTELWRNRTFVAANITSLFYGMAQFPWLLGGVLYVTEVWRYSELKAGLAMTPGALAASVGALALGRYTGRHGPRPATLLGLTAIAACGVWLTFGLTTQPAFLALWLPAGLLVGVGMGAATMGTSAAAALSAPPIRFASASGTNTTARQFGGALGVAVLAVTLQAKAGTGRDAYQLAYLICTIFVLVAIVVAAVGIRFTAPAAAPAPTTAAATGSHPAGTGADQPD